MTQISRRNFLATASVAALTAAAAPRFSLAQAGAAQPIRVWVGSKSGAGLLEYMWDPATAELRGGDLAARLSNIVWLAFSPQRDFLYGASEVDSFFGSPTGGVISFRVVKDQVEPLSGQPSAGKGTCHVAVDHTGGMLVSADYVGGSAASFKITNGQLSPAVWTEHYTQHGPNPARQTSAHAHFVSFSPDNRFAYINDLGGDCIHIYRPDPATAKMEPAGTYHGAPGSGPRTLHFHPNGHTAYCMNELASTVDVLEWRASDGSLTPVKRIELLPKGYRGPSTGCDTVITRDGRFVYFANRGDDFLYSFRADAKTGSLTPMARTSCGGKTPRNFVLDPTERWMLVANQDSDQISVLARNPETGALANEGKSFPAPAPMRILFS